VKLNGIIERFLESGPQKISHGGQRAGSRLV
jgi:hypothetical protein